MNTSTKNSKVAQIGKVVIIGLFSIIIVNISNRIYSSPFDFDEGVGLGLVKNILLSGKYSTYEAIFDPVITVGPTVYFPAALTLLSGNIFFPRIVILIYSLVLLFVVFKSYLENQNSKILFLCLVCLTPYYYYFSSHVLGEIPAITFSLIGLLYLSQKKYLLSGTFLILAIMTKNIFLISIFPAIYLLYSQRKNLCVKNIIIFLLPFFIITALWELYRLQNFHYSFNGYANNLYQMFRYNKGLSRSHPELFMERISMLDGAFGLNGFVFLISTILISIYCFIKNHNILIKSLIVFTITYLIYFFILGSTTWYRHFFPTIILFVIAISSIIDKIRFSKYSLIPILVVILVGKLILIDNSKYIFQQNLLPLFDQTGKRLFLKSPLLAEQLETAKYISSSLHNEKISGVVWYNAPEISYLSGKQIHRTPEDRGNMYLISHPFGRLLVPEVDARISKYPFKESVFETSFYKIYKKYE